MDEYDDVQPLYKHLGQAGVLRVGRAYPAPPQRENGSPQHHRVMQVSGSTPLPTVPLSNDKAHDPHGTSPQSPLPPLGGPKFSPVKLTATAALEASPDGEAEVPHNDGKMKIDAEPANPQPPPLPPLLDDHYIAEFTGEMSPMGRIAVEELRTHQQGVTYQWQTPRSYMRQKQEQEAAAAARHQEEEPQTSARNGKKGGKKKKMKKKATATVGPNGVPKKNKGSVAWRGPQVMKKPAVGAKHKKKEKHVFVPRCASIKPKTNTAAALKVASSTQAFDRIAGKHQRHRHAVDQMKKEAGADDHNSSFLPPIEGSPSPARSHHRGRATSIGSTTSGDGLDAKTNAQEAKLVKAFCKLPTPMKMPSVVNQSISPVADHTSAGEGSRSPSQHEMLSEEQLLMEEEERHFQEHTLQQSRRLGYENTPKKHQDRSKEIMGRCQDAERRRQEHLEKIAKGFREHQRFRPNNAPSPLDNRSPSPNHNGTSGQPSFITDYYHASTTAAALSDAARRRESIAEAEVKEAAEAEARQQERRRKAMETMADKKKMQVARQHAVTEQHDRVRQRAKILEEERQLKAMSKIRDNEKQTQRFFQDRTHARGSVSPFAAATSMIQHQNFALGGGSPSRNNNNPIDSPAAKKPQLPGPGHAKEFRNVVLANRSGSKQ